MVATTKKTKKLKIEDRKRVRGLGQELAAIRRKTGVKNRPVLMVNRNYQPINTVTLQSAVNKVLNEIAVILLPPGDEAPVWQEMSWADWENLTPKEGEVTLDAVNRVFKVPEIIKAKEFSDVPNRNVKLSRRAIYRRDKNTCQYCGKRAPLDELSIDHVWPKALGGKTEWDNVVVSCLDCNRKKGCMPLEQCGMALRSTPRMPHYDILQGRSIRVDSWQHFLGDCYWEVPLKD